MYVRWNQCLRVREDGKSTARCAQQALPPFGGSNRRFVSRANRVAVPYTCAHLLFRRSNSIKHLSLATSSIFYCCALNWRPLHLCILTRPSSAPFRPSFIQFQLRFNITPGHLPNHHNVRRTFTPHPLLQRTYVSSPARTPRYSLSRTRHSPRRSSGLYSPGHSPQPDPRYARLSQRPTHLLRAECCRAL